MGDLGSEAPEEVSPSGVSHPVGVCYRSAVGMESCDGGEEEEEEEGNEEEECDDAAAILQETARHQGEVEDVEGKVDAWDEGKEDPCAWGRSLL